MKGASPTTATQPPVHPYLTLLRQIFHVLHAISQGLNPQVESCQRRAVMTDIGIVSVVKEGPPDGKT